jgi:ParB/RepB/Spo0J family partition protein
MVAALKLAKQHVVYAIPIAAIVPSPSNPRKTYNEQKLAELAESIKSNKGLIHPITVRVKAEDQYEIVVGERRWRATGLAGLDTIDCKLVVMTDAEVAALQLVENCQREDVDALEEAQAFKLLIDDHSYSVEDVMAKIGRSEQYVRRRLRLTTLPAPARDALAKGEIVLGVAELVSLLPAEVQEKAATDVRRDLTFSTPMTIAAARALLLERYTLGLGSAPFDTADAELFSEAGACTGCPKRTGNQGVLFQDVATDDVCTDPECYGEKKERFWKLRVVEAKAAGQEVLTKKEYGQVFPYGNLNPNSGYVELNARCPHDPKKRTFRKLLGKQAHTLVIARDRTGHVRELLKAEEANKALEAAGHKFDLPKPPPVLDLEQAQEDRRKEKERHEKKLALMRATVPMAVALVVEKWEKREPTKAFWRWLAVYLLGSAEGQVHDRRREQLGDDPVKACEKLSEAELRGLCFELLFESDFYDQWSTKYSAALQDLCEQHKIDLKGLEKTAKSQLAQAAADAAVPVAVTDEAAE